MRKIIYVSGTRADFGLLLSTLQLASRQQDLDVSVCATGMHLIPAYGNTVDEIEATGLRICARIPVAMQDSRGGHMAIAIADELRGMVEVFERERPDLVLVLGDRGEMLAGALAAVHLNIPVIHLHGGERSGTIDEPVRHAISKLAHYHFVATAGARERLVRMGEQADHIFVTGAPGLDGLREQATRSREELLGGQNLDPAKPVALVVFHPVLQEAHQAGEQTTALLDAVSDNKLQALVLRPNADAGTDKVNAVLDRYRSNPGMRILVHIPRPDFVSWMSVVDVMAGNSSSGIIEAASFGLPVVNVGSRQNGRERSGNVTDVPVERARIAEAIRAALARGHETFRNVYGDGTAGPRIIELLRTLPLTTELLKKSNAY